ncbi:hypothetical protein QTP70_003910 [Hemibagrus guttatus]|uniref:Uncharacterized protein n=1 Tax=Hemibagrus guttatus TaxID=175788 RepID=A0AAE0QFL5_9TELE|nr:hypothetical protein QTP70_003910 [Hemibagrus guttatus]
MGVVPIVDKMREDRLRRRIISQCKDFLIEIWLCEILRENKGHDPKRRPWGKRAGIRKRLRACAHSTPLPSILLANVQLLENKLDDLRARVKFQRLLRLQSPLLHRDMAEPSGAGPHHPTGF